MLTGKPGTGKTTFARLVHKFLKAHGVLTGEFVEKNALELKGEYVGSTPLIRTLESNCEPVHAILDRQLVFPFAAYVFEIQASQVPTAKRVAPLMRTLESNCEPVHRTKCKTSSKW